MARSKGALLILIGRSLTSLRLTLDQCGAGTHIARRERLQRCAYRCMAIRIICIPIPGMTVVMTAMLAAPEGPAEPGGFDFSRMAYFDRLGAVGYTRTPVLVMAEPEGGAQMVNRVRTYLSNAIMTAVPGDSGAFASGVMTGDRSGISLDTVQALRDSNLAHLLAISGMNMAFITGFVFALIRYGVALVPPLALRVNSKKGGGCLRAGWWRRFIWRCRGLMWRRSGRLSWSW